MRRGPVSAVPGAQLVATVTGDGTFTPSFTGPGLVRAIGGGGQGGGGARGNNGASTGSPAGGGGGGGAEEFDQVFDFVAGKACTVTIGVGGSAAGGGAAANATDGTDGSSGGNTYLTDGSTTLTWPGARGGVGGSASVVNALAPGGSSHRGVTPPDNATVTSLATVFPRPGDGGYSGRCSATTQSVGQPGVASRMGEPTAVSSGGGIGADDTGGGGSGGGGGGSSVYGAGGNGGGGGKGSATTGVNGSDGSAATATNYGAGGGGGGGGGNGATASGDGGKGGAGAPGRMRIYRFA